MKNLRYFIIIAVLYSFQVKLKAQVLNNTSWTVYDTNSRTIVFPWQFRNDTILYGINSGQISTYLENGTVFSVIDIQGVAACLSDTGNYNFTISSDTLQFTVINDICQSRSDFYSNNYFVRIVTSVSEIENQAEPISIYPNPTNGIINFSFINDDIQNIEIWNSQGKLQDRINYNSLEDGYEIGGKAGVYLIRFILKNNKVITKKVLKN